MRQDGVGAAQSGRSARRQSLVYFGHLSDFQLTDEESPTRVEFIDPVGPPFEAAWRPWEAVNPHIDNAMVRQVNAFAAASPVPDARGKRRRMDLSINTGDAADSQQLNETRWVRTILEGGKLRSGSGVKPAKSTSPSCAGRQSSIVDGQKPRRYTGVQDHDDYVEGPNPYFYDPDQPAGPHSGWPRYTGLMDAAQRPFRATGLRVPSYEVVGNHDALVQGNAGGDPGLRAGGDRAASRRWRPRPAPTCRTSTPADLERLAPEQRILVPPDPKRRFVSKAQYKSVFQRGSQRDGHGFDFVDAAENQASGGAAAYYAWNPAPRMRFIVLDTTCDARRHRTVVGRQRRPPAVPVAGAPAAGGAGHRDGSRCCSATTRSRASPATFPTSGAPPCTGPDSHGHDTNPGCDVDPRASTPIHLGADLTALLHRYPAAVAWVAGHSHVNDITPFTDGRGRRLLGHSHRGRGRLAAAEPPGRVLRQSRRHPLDLRHGARPRQQRHRSAGADLSLTNPDPFQLASIGRTIAYNDFQTGGRACSREPCGEGSTADRNVELLLDNPVAP